MTLDTAEPGRSTIVRTPVFRNVDESAARATRREEISLLGDGQIGVRITNPARLIILIGRVQELRIRRADLDAANATGAPVRRVLFFGSEEDAGRYELRFELLAEGL